MKDTIQDSEDNYDRAFERLMRLEGHYSNDTMDPGGETVYGISKVHFPEMYEDGQPSLADAYNFFKEKFWSPLHCDEWPLEVSGRLFDAGVNCGVSRAVRWLQEGVNYLIQDESLLEVDGKLGPLTRRATKDVIVVYKENLAGWLAWRQGHFYQVEVSADLRERFGRGWMKRIGMSL